MSAALRGLAAGAFVLLLVAGCGKTEVPDRTTSAPAPDDAPKVAPVVPKGAEAPTPAPGQANDHSSPGFKTGGKNDPSK